MDGRIAPERAPADASADDEPEGSSRANGEPFAGLERFASKARRWIVKSVHNHSDKNSVEEKLDAIFRDDAENGAPRSRSERTLLANVMRLRDTRVEKVMIPRADIVALERGASLDETLEAFREGAHSRLPVYRETLDDPIGVVHLKDVALKYGFGPRANDFNLASLVRDVMVVPPSMRVNALLERMQATRKHMALVVDEYGGVDGLVTIEDLIEQIVGDIEDEHDNAEGPSWIELNGGVFLVEARAEIKDFEKAAGVSLLAGEWDEEIDTLGGLVFVLTGRVPSRGEVIQHPDGHEFEIVDADPRRIKRLRVRISKPDAVLADAAE